MKHSIDSLQKEIESFAITSSDTLEEFKLTYLVRKGSIANLFKQLKDVSPDERRAVGQLLNTLKTAAEKKYEDAKETLASSAASEKNNTIDLTLPGRTHFLGSEHPVQKVLGDMKQIFTAMGFAIETGPELECGIYNFDKLNFLLTIPQGICRTPSSSSSAKKMGMMFFSEHTPPRSRFGSCSTSDRRYALSAPVRSIATKPSAPEAIASFINSKGSILIKTSRLQI